MTTVATPQARSLPDLLDPAALVAIKNLELRARVIVEGFWNGLHRSPFHGFSVEFTEYRQYTHGDDPRYLDWRLYARSDRYYIKKFEDETNLRSLVVLDTSASMNFKSQSVSKRAYAQSIAATLGYFLHKQGDAVGLLSFDTEVGDYLPARNRTGHLRQYMVALSREGRKGATHFSPPLKQITSAFSKRGLVILISDMLGPIDQIETGLREIAAMGHEVLVLQVLDPREVEFDFSEPALFRDLEGEDRLYVEPKTARANYLEQLEKHQAALANACTRSGVARYVLQTNQPLQTSLYALLQSRTRKWRGGTRRR